MPLIDKIEKMQKKPDYVKRRIVFASVFVIMFIIVAVWVSTLRLTVAQDEKKEASISSPFTVFKGIVADGIAEVADGVSQTIESFDKIKTNEQQQQ